MTGGGPARETYGQPRLTEITLNAEARDRTIGRRLHGARRKPLRHGQEAHSLEWEERRFSFSKDLPARDWAPERPGR